MMKKCIFSAFFCRNIWKFEKKIVSLRPLKKIAKTAAEKYYYREQYDKRTLEKLTVEKEVHDALCDWNVAKRERERMNKTYSITVEQVNKIYNERYAKYTERAIKKLNKIHGLKYKIADMSEIERGA